MNSSLVRHRLSRDVKAALAMRLQLWCCALQIKHTFTLVLVYNVVVLEEQFAYFSASVWI